jgi:competence protein ComEC
VTAASAWWRHVALAGAVAGLILAPGVDPGEAAPAAVIVPLACVLLGLARPGRSGSVPAGAALLWLALVAATGAGAGLGLGAARVASIDGSAATGHPRERIAVAGFVAAPPRVEGGELRMPLHTDRGRVLLVVDADQRGPQVGERLIARGLLAEPGPWRASRLRRLGIGLELRARAITRTGPPRAGPAGLLDRIRGRAEDAVGAGLEPPQAALALGFVLGQDDRIDQLTRAQFRRSGLAHLLAVSGQNVMLLAILAGILFAALGVGPRARLGLILALIAIYVPVAGAGPSIQRAGVMGAAGIVAGLAGRTTDRVYLPLLAACLTLLLNPLAAGDVGWQLSFAAVIGIALWSAPIAVLLRERLTPSPLPARLAGPLSEGAALTLAATLATGPLMAYHFETVSLASLPANLLVLPAVPPVMWLGMLAAIAGQLPLIPTAPLAAVEGPLLDYITAVARLLASADWAVIDLPAPSTATLGAIYAGMLAGVAGAIRALRRRQSLGLGRGAGALALVGVALLLVRGLPVGGAELPQPAPETLRLTAIDVGQGDAILLQQAAAPSALFDTGPPGAGLGDSLRRLGVEQLGLVLITHDQRDHAGAFGEVLAAARVERLALARPAPGVAGQARAAGAEVIRVGEGSEVELGGLRLQVLSPTPGRSTPGTDPNADSIVVAARFGGWGTLLTGDAEAEAAAIDPGPIDVLKVAHHGSADAGLATLLDRSAPRVAMISAGADNGYGHPTDEVLGALAERGICVLRTDLHGDSYAELGPRGMSVGSERGGELPAACRASTAAGDDP